MNKEKRHYVIFGGAGYLGTYLVKRLSAIADNEISIVTRNKSKQILFSDFLNVKIIGDINEVQGQEIYIINLAYGLDISFKKTKQLNKSIISSIKKLCGNNNVISLTHVSSIVLSQEKDPSRLRINKADTYKYAKSYAEVEIQKISTQFNINTTVVRSGNIIGPGSIWLMKICKRILECKPINCKSENIYCNATYVCNLAYFIEKCSLATFGGFNLFNLNEFGDLSWSKFVDLVSEEMGITAISWKTESLQHIKTSLKADVFKSFNESKKTFILKLYKGPVSGRHINIILEKLGVKGLDKKVKKNIKTIEKDPYPDSQEFALMTVFMNDIKVKNDFDKEFIGELPYDFRSISVELKNWIKISGFSNLSF